MQDHDVSDDDLRLVDALQIWPRAPWSTLGPVLGADPVTLARRWARLEARGIAWVTVQPWAPTSSGAMIEVECHPGHLEQAVTELQGDPECLSIDLTSGARDLMLTVACADTSALNRYVVGRLHALPGARTVRAQPVVRVVAMASQWRVRMLDAAQVVAIERARDGAAERQGATRQGATRATTVHDADLEALRALLAADGRVTTRAVADAMHLPMRRARDLLAAALAHHTFGLRTDMARWATGWPVSAWYFLRVPAAQLPGVRLALGKLRHVRAALGVAGPANLLLNVWLPSLEDVEHLEEVLEQQLPGVSVMDRSLVMAVRKRMGRVFDDAERPTGVVVPWRAGGAA